jgi:hypothetical protein
VCVCVALPVCTSHSSGISKFNPYQLAPETLNTHVGSSCVVGGSRSPNKMWRQQECIDQHHHGEAAEI